VDKLFKIFALVLLASLPAAAQAEWWQARTEHFIIYSESSARDAEAFAARLERFDMALRSLQNISAEPIQSDSQRLTIFRRGNVEYIGRLYGAQGVAGFYIPRIGGSVAFTPARKEGADLISYRRDSRTDLDPQSVLFHEYAHHFMFQHFSAAYPQWYVEGFAETAATIDLQEGGSFHLGNPPQYRVSELLQPLTSAKRMLTNTRPPTAELFYSYYSLGWLLNHYLTFEPSRQGQLKQYLRLINAGTAPPEAARKAFGDLDVLDRDLARYRNNRPLPGALVKPSFYEPPAVTMRKLGADEEAIVRVALRSKRGVNRKAADEVAGEARSVAAKYPSSYPVQIALAEAEFDDRKYDAAEAAANRALALSPKSAEAMLYIGRAHLERAKEKKDKALFETARKWFEKAHVADREHAEPLFYNYLTYHDAGLSPPKTAVTALERAFDIAPFAGEIRLVLALQLLVETEGKLARTVLTPLAIGAHQSTGAKALRAVVELLDAGKVEEAHTALAAEMARLEQEQKSGKSTDDD
jgi:tetratricopeptide (TPR) repeat protein